MLIFCLCCMTLAQKTFKKVLLNFWQNYDASLIGTKSCDWLAVASEEILVILCYSWVSGEPWCYVRKLQLKSHVFPVEFC